MGDQNKINLSDKFGTWIEFTLAFGPNLSTEAGGQINIIFTQPHDYIAPEGSPSEYTYTEARINILKRLDASIAGRGEMYSCIIRYRVTFIHDSISENVKYVINSITT